jgi:predicted anti-sigma-YlaC factor YlaD
VNHQEVQERLSALLDGELSTPEEQEVRRHLGQCEMCHAELAKYRSVVQQAARLPRSLEPERDLWAGIEQRMKQVSPPSSVARVIRRESRSYWKQAFAVAATLVVLVGSFWLTTKLSAPAWNVATLQGTVKIGSSEVGGVGKFRVGQLLETDNFARARVEVGLIGHVEVEPNSRVRLVDASLREHRLALDRGTIHAKIWAPPRLFFVETPSALAVDLGCAYTLHVDSVGASILEVTSGWVALEFGGRESIVPAGNLCATRPGSGPGTPYRDDASVALKRALTRYDFERAGELALITVLAEARNMDSITLWHLLFRETGKQREQVYDRLAALVPAPEGVTREGLLAGDPEMIKAWQKHLNLGVKLWWKFWQ